MASYHPELSGGLPPAPNGGSLGGPLLSLNEWAALAEAPRRPAGTEVSVRASTVKPLANVPDHMFVQYDDGQTALIARGGPSKTGGEFIPGWLDGSNRVAARVDPAQQSPDYGTEYRTLTTRFLPGVTADEAAGAARQHAQGVNRGGNAYGLDANSNSYAADVAEPIFGFRPHDAWTWGYQTHLRDRPAPPEGLFNPASLAPVLRDPL